MIRLTRNIRYPRQLGLRSYSCDCESYNYNGVTLPLPIDFETNLNGTKPVEYKHVLVPSEIPIGKLPSKIEMMPGTLAGEIIHNRKLASPHHPIIVLAVHVSCIENGNVAVYPDGITVQIDNLNDVPSFVHQYLTPPDYLPQPVYNPFKKEAVNAPVPEKRDFLTSPVRNPMVLICGHTARDARCGILGPLLHKEFSLQIDKRKLDVSVGLISHIGGHAYAGNVLIFPRSGPAIWYGRVFPPDVERIIEDTVVGGKVITEMHRGYS